MTLIRPHLEIWQGGPDGYYRLERFINATFTEGNTANPREYEVWLYNRRNTVSRRVAETGPIEVRIDDLTWQSHILLKVDGIDDPNSIGITPQSDGSFTQAHGHAILSIPMTCGRRLLFKIDQTTDPGFSSIYVPVSFDYPK